MCSISQWSWPWMKQVSAYCLNQNSRGLTSVVGSIIIVLRHTLKHEARSCVVYISLYPKHRQGKGQYIQMCLCLSMFTNTHTLTEENMLRLDPPICSSSFQNPKTKLMALCFNYLSSHHFHHTKFIQILPQSVFQFLSHIKRIHVFPSHNSATQQSGNHNVHIKVEEPEFMTDDLFNRFR